MLKRLFATEIKKKYQDGFVSSARRIFYFLGFKIQYRNWKVPPLFGENNHIILNGREVRKIKGLKISIDGNNNRVEISLNKESKLFSSRIYISGDKNLIQIMAPKVINNMQLFVAKSGNKVCIGENALINPAVIHVCYPSSTTMDCCQLLIGKDFSCGEQLNISLYGKHRKIKIGDDCMFSWKTYVWTADGHFIYDKKSGNRLNLEKDVVIGDHVWVGRHASVHKGAKVPNGCIVGANSFVTKTFREKNVILAGAPAKIVRRNIRWER